MLLLTQFSCNELEVWLGRNKSPFAEERPHLLFFHQSSGKTCTQTIQFFQLIYLQSRKYDSSEMPVVDVNILVMCNEGMRTASAEIGELINRDVVLSS